MYFYPSLALLGAVKASMFLPPKDAVRRRASTAAETDAGGNAGSGRQLRLARLPLRFSRLRATGGDRLNRARLPSFSRQPE